MIATFWLYIFREKKYNGTISKLPNNMETKRADNSKFSKTNEKMPIKSGYKGEKNKLICPCMLIYPFPAIKFLPKTAYSAPSWVMNCWNCRKKIRITNANIVNPIILIISFLSKEFFENITLLNVNFILYIFILKCHHYDDNYNNSYFIFLLRYIYKE